jgi:hypothetical protein
MGLLAPAEKASANRPMIAAMRGRAEEKSIEFSEGRN